MEAILRRFKRGWKYLASFWPSELPVGVKAFNQFVEDVLFTYNLQQLPSYKHTIATMIMQLGPITHRKSKRFFARSVKKAMANQIAYDAIVQIREARKKQEEVTPIQGEASESVQNEIVSGTEKAVG